MFLPQDKNTTQSDSSFLSCTDGVPPTLKLWIFIFLFFFRALFFLTVFKQFGSDYEPVYKMTDWTFSLRNWCLQLMIKSHQQVFLQLISSMGVFCQPCTFMCESHRPTFAFTDVIIHLLSSCRFQYHPPVSLSSKTKKKSNNLTWDMCSSF